MEYRLQLNTSIKCLTLLNTLFSYLAVACMAKKCIEIYNASSTIVPLIEAFGLRRFRCCCGFHIVAPAIVVLRLQHYIKYNVCDSRHKRPEH